MDGLKIYRILLADDDRALCELLTDYLTRAGFAVDTANDGDAALARLRDRHDPPDLVILDVMMPGRDGLSTLRELRHDKRIPVIMLSARGEPVDRVAGLELGADDYMAKPFLPRELLARIHARLRSALLPDTGALAIGNLRLYRHAYRAEVGGQPLTLTGAEFLLLLGLAQQVGVVVDKETLAGAALGHTLKRFDRTVDVHVSRLRHKLAEASPDAPRIGSVRGVGYVLTVATP